MCMTSSYINFSPSYGQGQQDIIILHVHSHSLPCSVMENLGSDRIGVDPDEATHYQGPLLRTY